MLPIPEQNSGHSRPQATGSQPGRATTPVAPGFPPGRATMPVAPGFHPGRATTPVAPGFPPGRATMPVAPGFHPGRARRRNAGFSLTEVLVASAIFITVFSGVVLLYQGAVSTVLQGRQAIAAFEQARGSLAILERDLKRAFTQRDAGDKFQFYGRPEGLMMVGALPDGGFGRITYVVSPAASNTQFQTTLTEPWRNVMHRLRDQVFEEVFERTRDRGAALAAADQAEAAFRNPALGGYAAPAIETDLVEFSVVVDTQSLLRLQESTVTSLDAFPNLNQGTNPLLRFPAIDTTIGAPYADAYNANDGGPSLMDQYILRGLNPTALTASFTGNADLRSLLLDLQFSGDQNFGIDGAVIDALAASRKRQAYLEMLVQAPEGVFFQNAIAFWNSPLQAAQYTNFSAITQENPLDYVVTENILRRAALQRADGGGPFVVNAPGVSASILIDALYTPGIFAYSLTAQDTARQYFNDNSNIPGYEAFQADPGLVTVQELDTNIQLSLGGINNARYEGTPLAPRLPAVVHAGFWLVFEKPTAGSPDFRRWFTQIIEVPSAVTRTAPNRMTPNQGPGASAVAL